MSEASRTPETEAFGNEPVPDCVHELSRSNPVAYEAVSKCFKEACDFARSLETQRNAALEREQRLREALEEVVLCHGSSMPTKEFERRGGDWWAIRNTSIEKARAALAAKGEK